VKSLRAMLRALRRLHNYGIGPRKPHVEHTGYGQYTVTLPRITDG